MNATAIIRENRKPNTRYATNANENVIAQWIGDRWEIIHIYTITNKWINGGGGLLVNGKPLVAQNEFIEVLESPTIEAIDRTTKDGSCRLVGFFSDNAERELFSFYIDELTFDDSELIGLTEDQAHQLRHQRDVAFLRS